MQDYGLDNPRKSAKGLLHVKTLNSGNIANSAQDSLGALIKAVRDAEDGAYPVEQWEPEYCGEMDMVIKRDGSWWHEGTRITRQPLIDLFAKVLRRDADGRYFLVTPVEKIEIQVERLPFLAVRVDQQGQGKNQRLFFTTNVGDVVEAGTENPVHVDTDPQTLEPTPMVRVRGRLDALIARPVFYELVEAAEIRDGQLGVMAASTFFALGPKGILDAPS